MTIAAILGNKGRDVIYVSPTQTVMEAIALLAQHRIGAVPVIDGGKVVGVFSERDVIHGLIAGDTSTLQRPVAETMTTPALTVTPAEPVLAALSLMTRRRIRHLPVVEDGRIIGIVSIGDLVKYRIEKIEADAAAMREYIQQA
ncbi:MAG: CBS domain-containing protein [Candidatus Sphingomonas colombiensis]|nr:CBS domain-containing protein [Sphingomonas sp.]WEK44264.1 MAG: CBS domain-containing protein [Sphingomonas sp.]